MSPCRLSRNATECVDHAEIHLYAVSESINQSIDRLIDRSKKISDDVVRLFGQSVILYFKNNLFNQSAARATLLSGFLFPPYEKWAERLNTHKKKTVG